MIASRVWSFGWALGLAFAGLLPFILSTNVTLKPSDYVILILVSVSGAVFLWIPIELILRSWLPATAFLWGADGRRANVARRVTFAVLVALPLWFIGSAASALLFGK